MATLVGQTVSHYKILEHLGSGGMGVVYKAEDTRLRRTVALKFLPPNLTQDPAAKVRFVHEAQAASALEHTNICSVHEIGEHGDQTFLVMGYYEGETLKKRIESGPLPLDQVTEIALQVARGLSRAHEAGIVHRDIKPANIIVTTRGEVKIVDFGLAKLSGRTLVTRTGTTLGTAAYMSPEQARGDAVDHRTDIWSLGVVLYEMITGQRPFRSDYEQALIYLILNAEPEPPSKLRPETAPGLAQIIGHALVKQAADRYQTMNEMLQDLTAVTEGLRPITAKVRPAVAKLAVLPLVNLTGDPGQEFFSDGLTHEMIARLGRLDPQCLSVIARTSVMRYKKGDMPIDQIGRELGVDFVLEGSAQREGGRVRVIAELIQVRDQIQLWTDIFEREMSGILALQNELAVQVARALAIKLLPSEQVRLASAQTVNPEAYEAYLRASQTLIKLTPADLDTAERYCLLAIERDSSFAPAYAIHAIVWIVRQQMGYTAPSEAGPKAKAAAARAIELDKTVSDAHYALAAVLTLTDWDFAAADPEWQRAVELNPGNAEALAMYSNFLMLMDRPDESLVYIERALKRDPFNAIVLSFYAFDLVFTRRFDDAICAARDVLRVQPGYPIAQQVLWISYAAKAMPREAADAAKGFLSGVYGDDALEAMLEAGFVESGYAEGMKRVADALAARFRTAFTLPTDIANFFVEAQENAKALDWLEKAVELRDPAAPYLLLPTYDRIREDPRFHKLRKGLGLPAGIRPVYSAGH